VVTLGGAWQYIARGAVSSVTPAAGQAGTYVTIAGVRLRV
jgi:hypothetical protein